jgi:broad specificity phosphatase PhoE
MIAGRELALQLEPCPGLVEYDFGEATGATYGEVRERYRPGWPGDPGAQLARLFVSFILEPRPAIPREEGFDAFAGRVTATTETLLGRGGTVATVTHGGVIGAILARAAGEPRRVPAGALIENAAGLVLERGTGGAWLTRLL